MAQAIATLQAAERTSVSKF